MIKKIFLLLFFLLPSCLSPKIKQPNNPQMKLAKPNQELSNAKNTNRWTYYSRSVFTDDALYNLPKKNEEKAQNLWQNLDLKKISHWKKIYVQTDKMFKTLDDYNTPKYQLFDKIFFEQQLSQIHKLYQDHYFKENVWTPHSPKIEENSFDKDFTFVEKINVSDQANIAVIGDLHSGFHSLLQFIMDLENKGFFEEDKLLLKKDHHIIFLGDLVDRGPYGLEILFFVFYLKQLNFDKVHINNGNHEDFSTFSRFGLADEIKGQFGIEMKQAEDYPFLSKLLQSLPSAFYLNFNGKNYHLSHGVVNPSYAGADSKGFFTQETSLLKDFLESDSLFDYVNDEQSDNYRWSDCSQVNKSGSRMQSPTRGSEKLFTFDHRFIDDYLKFHNLTAIIRGHQDMTNLGLIRSTYDKEEKTIILDTNKEFELDNGIYPGVFWELTKPHLKIELIEEKDFTVLTTSSASIARKIDTAYLILSRN